MLYQTFCHIPGIGYTTEQRIWQAGISHWQEFLNRPPATTRIMCGSTREIIESSLAAIADDPRFFTRLLKRVDYWRMFPHFRHRCAYLDIETNGLHGEAEITTIALYDGQQVYTYVNGENLDALLDDLEHYEVLITYNGTSFDIPFIERYFHTRLDQAHIDLRYILARLGCRGGLKGSEKEFGINRGMLNGLDGAGAVLLWREYQRTSDPAALETLLAYNVEDTVNLERLLVEAYNRNVAATPFAQQLYLPFPEPPQLMHQPDHGIVERINRGY